MSHPIEPLSGTPATSDLADLKALLRDVVEGGASVGFMLPLADAEVAAFWSGVFADVATGKRIVLVARGHGRIVGTVQLQFAPLPNARHRCDLQKLLVMRDHRGRGLGSALVHAAEAAARERGRTLIVLDTSTSGNALGIYDRCGYTRVGVIPRYANDPDGPLIDTAIYYKEIASARPNSLTDET